jgi:hypothetical protein
MELMYIRRMLRNGSCKMNIFENIYKPENLRS